MFCLILILYCSPGLSCVHVKNTFSNYLWLVEPIYQIKSVCIILYPALIVAHFSCLINPFVLSSKHRHVFIECLSRQKIKELLLPENFREQCFVIYVWRVEESAYNCISRPVFPFLFHSKLSILPSKAEFLFDLIPNYSSKL